MNCIADPKGSDKGGQCGFCDFVGHEIDCPVFEQEKWWRKVLRIIFVPKTTKENAN